MTRQSTTRQSTTRQPLHSYQASGDWSCADLAASAPDLASLAATSGLTAAMQVADYATIVSQLSLLHGSNELSHMERDAAFRSDN